MTKRKKASPLQPLSSSSIISPTLLHQSSPVEPTLLMRDSRLPKKIDKTKLSFPSSSSSSSTRKARNFHNVIHTTRNQNKNNRNNYNNKFAMIYTEFVQSPGEKNKIDTKRRGGRDFSPSVGSQHSSSATSCATDTTNTMVYVRDSHYVWLPAQIQSMIGHEEEEEEDDEDEGGNDSGELSNSVLANIVLPDDWVETTDLHNESSITELEYYLRSNKRGKKGGKKFGFGRLSSSPKRKTQIDCDNDAKVEKKDDRPIHQKKRRIYHYEKESGGDGDNHITAKGVTRTVHLKHYAHGALPLQNVERKCRGQMKVMTSIFSGQHSSSLPCPQIVNARDMADLAYLHEAAILYNLKLRHADKLPYTRVGDIVVAVNPFQWINGLYSSRKQALYASHLIWNVKDVEDENASRDYKKKHKKKSTEMCASGEDSADCASISSDFDESSTINSLPKDDVEIKHQPMVHGSYYSRLGLEPHVYETASLAYRGLASDQQNQTILVSGISGAGKTETVKIVMSNLATIEQTRPFYHGDSLNLSDNDINVAEGVTGIVQQLLESNPVFEAFGCAKTIRNDNSSRFGRFTQLQFQVEDLYDAVTNSRTSVPECILVGSSCQSFLLEKSRIISHAPGERLFHIFYQLLASPEEEKVRIWKCLANTTCETFTYLGTTPTSSIEGVPDREAWRHTVKALKLFGFDGSLLRSLMRSLCIVLQLGNLTFEDTGDDDEGSEISSSSELSKLAKLIGIPESSISIAMSRRVKTIGGEEVIVKLNQIDAKNGCDALAKAIYSIIFDKLVEQINEHTSVDARENCDDRNIGTISLLDIFGFDKFDTNRFEQLCINYANERLQQRYVLDNFRAVKEEYTAEGIDIFDFKMVDNSSIVNLLGSKSSIISCLNEECLRPQGSAESFVFKIKSIHGDKPGLLIDKLQDECEFGVKHFAGPVTYDAASFLKSNNDPTPQDLLECACNTSNEFLRKELEKLLKSKESSRDGGSTRNSMPSRRTVLVKFRSQLNELMKYIEETSVRYIRCIKPNSDMKPKITNHRQTINQLESAGLITAITISRETFPNHLKYDIIWERFLCLYDYDDILGSGRLFSISHSFSFNDKQLKENVTKMLSSLLTIPFIRSDGARVPSFSCGKTKVYFRTGALEHLEGERMEFYSLRAEIIQSWFRCQEARIQFKQTRSLIILTQAKVRRYISRKEFLTVKLSATSFQALFKGFVARQTYGKERSACIVIQSWSRCQNLRLKYNRSKKLVIYTQARIRRFIARRSYLLIILIVKLQSYLKCFTNQRIFQKYRYSAILIQSTVRGIKARQYYVELRRGAIKIQSKWRSYYLKEKYTRIIKATIMLQSYYKARVAVNSYAQARSSCLLIQCHFRMFLANSSLVRFKEMKDSFDQTQAILIQSWYRGIKTRLAYAQQLHSIVVIQSFARMVVPRMNYLLEKELMDDEDDFSQSSNALDETHPSTQDTTIIDPLASNVCNNVQLKETESTNSGSFHSNRIHDSEDAELTIAFLRQQLMYMQASNKKLRAESNGVYQRGIKLDTFNEKEKLRGAILIQSWYRGIKTRLTYSLLRDASIIIQSFLRMAIIRMDYLLTKELLSTDDNFERSNILEERHPSIENLDTYLKGNDSTLLGKKNIENQSYLGPSSFAHNQAVENDGIDDFRMTISFLRQQLSHKQKENDELGVEKETIDRDKNMLLDYSQVLESRVHVANTRSRELQKSNQLLVTEVTSLRKENTQIRKRLLSIEEKKDTDLSPIHAKYQRILSDKDADIKALKFSAADNLENGAIVSMRLEKQFEQERETYLTEIHKLKSSMKDTRANTNGYKEKLISVLETSQSNRNEETRKLRKEIKRLQRKLHEKHDESSQKSAQIDTSTTMVHISNLKDQMTTNDEQRHQSLLKIVASAKNVGNSKETRNGENSHLYSTYPQARRVNHNPTSQLIKTVEEFYISESERGKVCTRLLNNISQSVNKQTLTNSDSSRKGDGIG